MDNVTYQEIPWWLYLQCNYQRGHCFNFQQEMFGNGITNIINTQIVKILYFQITRVLQDLTPEIMPPVSGGKKPLDAGAKFDGAQPLLIYSLHSPVSPCTIVQYTVCPDMMMLQLQVHWFSVYRKLHKSLSYWDCTYIERRWTWTSYVTGSHHLNMSHTS